MVEKDQLFRLYFEHFDTEKVLQEKQLYSKHPEYFLFSSLHGR